MWYMNYISMKLLTTKYRVSINCENNISSSVRLALYKIYNVILNNLNASLVFIVS